MLLGEHTALSERRRTHTATTQTAVIAWDVPVQSLRAALRDDAELTYRVLLSTIDLVLEKNTEAVRRAGQTTKERLASVLLDLHAGGAGEDIRLGHAELAMMVGSTRESVTRALAQLRDRKAIETRGRAIVVIDEPVLADISGRSTPPIL
ncbi:MAG: Crp/Fnr family transcriptional regulator, partial [Actinomycetota bacterium]